MKNPKVSIIILNWNGLNDTIECLESVRQIDYPNYEIIVVDNASFDGSADNILKIFPEVKVIKNRHNLGYAEGNNVGIEYALKRGDDFVLLLNNDTIVDTKIVENFINAANTYPEAGIFSGKIYYYSDPNRIWFAGGQWDKKNLRFFHKGCSELDNDGAYSEPEEIDYACGCALFFRKEVADRIGLFDKRFFLTYEDTDWCCRAKKAGFKSLYVPNAKVWHKVSTSFGGQGPLYAYFYTRNRLLWAQKNLSFRKRWSVYITVMKELFPCTFNLNKYVAIKRFYWDLLSYKEPKSKAKLLGMKDFALGRFGNCDQNIWRLNNRTRAKSAIMAQG